MMGRQLWMAVVILCLGALDMAWGSHKAPYRLSQTKKVSLPSQREQGLLAVKLQHMLDQQNQTAAAGDDDQCYIPPGSNAETRCSIIRRNEACGEVNALVDYLEVIYCSMGSRWGNLGALVGTVVLLVWLLLLMSMMGSTADVFFVQPLTLLSDYLKLSPAVAGCTLLAFGNGAPDIFTAHAAIGSQGDLPLVLSALLGAALLVTTCVLASVILVQKGQPLTGVSRSSLLRDVILYLCIVLTTIAICYDGVITVWEAASFIGVYIVYILSIFIKHRKHVRQSKKAALALSAAGMESYRIPFFLEFSVVDTESSDSDVEGHPMLNNSGERRSGVNNKRKMSDTLDGEHGGLYMMLLREEREADVPGLAIGRHGWMGAIQALVEYPFTLLRYSTTPLIDKHWGPRRRLLACFWPAPFGALLAITTSTSFSALYLPISPSCPIPTWSLLLLLGPIITCLCYTMTMSRRRPQGWFKAFLASVAFISSMLWMNLLASEIVAVVESFGILLNISSGILGVTVVAMSNSLGDWFSNVAVARKGHGAMSVAACFGAPVLNDLLGIGIALTSYCLRTRSSYHVTITNHGYQQVKLIWCFLVPVLLLTLVAFPLTRFSPGRAYAYTLLSIYIAFLTMAVLTETGALRLPW